ncbi:gfo/Idh/MocA family oxidoreductase [Sediminibacillus dalangtanensis]|uniref:Gfo/Idh/MocA family oxidoreductase n=1 Tax=Sediminibacillus dalangtanensis TaxID=2729421 RepID=A0ABX7VQ69_9BACI|nr:Gfo/Idh/MocA family oxidoreductase [Sediminibacillus dalangtanensis]QTM99014.1 gfo/Idh/MocA family oxidoreductase [Sediminibacillus dalangtanensis]
MINFGVVGCGRVAGVHTEAIAEADHANLYALCDIDHNRIRKYADHYQVENVYTDFEAMLRNPAVDVVNICTPHGLHAEMAVRAMEAGKHVMIEKPLAPTLEEADRIIKTAKRHRVKATVVQQNRFNEAILTTRRALQEERFGKLTYGTAYIRWRREQDYYDQDAWRGTKAMADGVLMNQAIHTIDLLVWLMGPVKRVTGRTATSQHRLEMEDLGIAMLEFESGTLGIVDGTTTVFPSDLGAGLNLFGQNGMVCIGGNAANRIEKWRFGRDFQQEENQVLALQKENPASVYGIGHKHCVKDFVQAIREDHNPFISLEDGRYALKLILAIYQSNTTGLPVDLTK